MAAAGSSSRVKTFTISFSEKDYDESADARLVARHLNTEHHEESFSPDTLLDLLPVMAEILDEPLADPSILPTYLLSRFTRNSVTVALGGDGGDEIFGGYPTYYAHRLYESYRRLPGFARAAVRAAVERLPVSTKYFSFDFKAKRFIRGDGFELPERHARWMSVFLPEEIGRLFTPEFAPSVKMDGVYDELNGNAGAPIADPLRKAMYLDAKMYLQDDVLVKVDRASMAVSLEVRAPFLDREVVEFAAGLPASWNSTARPQSISFARR
jgi:Asparagine synthase (glutamine-hydrolyzing)